MLLLLTCSECEREHTSIIIRNKLAKCFEMSWNKLSCLRGNKTFVQENYADTLLILSPHDCTCTVCLGVSPGNDKARKMHSKIRRRGKFKSCATCKTFPSNFTHERVESCVYRFGTSVWLRAFNTFELMPQSCLGTHKHKITFACFCLESLISTWGHAP